MNHSYNETPIIIKKINFHVANRWNGFKFHLESYLTFINNCNLKYIFVTKSKFAIIINIVINKFGKRFILKTHTIELTIY